MWDFLGNRAAVVLISVTCGCVLIYNAWGAILALAFSLLLVVYACYSLLANDSLVSPYAYHVLVYLWEAILELRAIFATVIGYGIEHVRKLWHSAICCYRERFPFRMDKRRRSKCYQLSSDSYATGAAKIRDSLPPSSWSSSSLIGQLSPIPRDDYRSSYCDNDIIATTCDKFYYDHAGDHNHTRQSVFAKYTSTPLLRADRDESRNGDVGGMSPKRISPVYSQKHTLNRGENMTQFSPKCSPWGTSISPTMRPRPAGMKTVQTVAGPLLASTRYNIDPKVYTDVSSPGLTTRLTKYATEARNKLTHQSQYGTGQFPKVNLQANPIPLLNTKLTKMRMPVTVRLAPPEVIRYSPPERQRLLSNIRHAANTSPNKSTTNVVQVLREISLKRHASREDVSFDVAKKQRTEDLFNEEREMVLEEPKQKRSRDESSKSEEDLSPQNKSIRPAKRTKTRSCYDILNSLSSSINVSSGVKRKAIDISRSGTPDFEKHFKSLESAQPNISPILSQCPSMDTSKTKFNEIYSRSPEKLSSDKAQESPLIKGILKTSNKESEINVNKATLVAPKNAKSVETINSEPIAPTKSVKLVDKLFMRAEPERNEQLKLLVEEQGNIKAKFTTDDVEEIKKEDIRNMRQTSMKARLQSMFDAISGKAEGRINPDVVIQADDVNTIIPVTCSVICATLNSLTTTTNVNTTPISIAVVVPGGILSASKSDTKPSTAFSLSNVASPVQSNVPITATLEKKGSNVIAKTGESFDQTKVVPITSAIVSAELLQKTASAAISSTASTFIFGKPVTEAPAATSSSLPSFGTSVSSSGTTTLAATTAAFTLSTSAKSIPGGDKTPLVSAFVPISSTSTSSDKIQTNNTVITSAIISLSTTANIPTSSTFTFGNSKLSPVSPAIPSQTSASSMLSQSTGTSLLPINTSAINSAASFNSVPSSTLSSIATTTSAPVQTSPFSFGGNTAAGNSTASQAPKSSDLFAFGQSGSNVQSANAFRNALTNQPTSLPQDTNKPFSFTPNVSASTTTSNTFGTNALTTTPVFGLSTAPTFSLGTSTIPTSSINKSLYAFGANSGSATATTASNAAVFGTMNNNAPPPTFGPATTITSQFGTPTAITTPRFRTPAATVPQFGTPTTTVTPQFGTPTTTVTPQFGTPTTTAIPQFGVSTVSIFAPTPSTTVTNIFGTTNSQPPVFGAATGSTTGTTNIFNTLKTTAATIFPTSTKVSSSDNTAGANLFSGVKASVNTSSSAAPSVFGSVAPTIFGQTKASTTSFGSAGAVIFGNTSTPLFGPAQTTSVPTFGITNVSTSSTSSTFDTAHNATSAFGTPSAVTAVTNAQTASAPAFAGTTGMFGSNDNASVPIFGTNATPAAGAFVSSATGTFGGQNPATLITFGATSGGNNSTSTSSNSTVTTFGDNKSPFAATPAPATGFGGSSIPAFGPGNNANNASNNANNMFFGNNQKNGQQQNTTFPFASNFNAGSNNATTASSVPFQFGSTAPKPPAATGFNFAAPPANPTISFGTSAAPTFNPSTPGMFSIGSGSTAPRYRNMRTRKPR